MSEEPILAAVLPVEFMDFLADQPQHVAGTQFAGDASGLGEEFSVVALDGETISAFLRWLLDRRRPGMALRVLRAALVAHGSGGEQGFADGGAACRMIIAGILSAYPDADKPGAA